MAEPKDFVGRRFPGEAEDLAIVRAIGERWGYGNCVEELLTAWHETQKERDPFFILHHKIAMGEVAQQQLARIKRAKERAAAVSSRRRGRGEAQRG